MQRTAQANCRSIAGGLMALWVFAAFPCEAGSPVIEWLIGGHSREVNQVAFSPDGGLVASAADDATVKLWRASDGLMVRTLRHGQDDDGGLADVSSVAFSPNGLLLASGGADRVIRIWRVATGESVTTVAGETNDVRAVAFSPDGTLLASGNDRGVLRLWRTTDWSLLRQRTLDAAIFSVAFSPDGTMVAAATDTQFLRSPDDGGRITFWRVSNGGYVRAMATNYVRSIAFSPSGEWLAAGGARTRFFNATGVVDLWRVSDGLLARSFSGHSNVVRAVAFSPDGTLASAGFDTTVKLWQVSTGGLIRVINNVGGERGYSSNEMRAVAFNPNGSLIATGDKSDHVKLWSPGDGTLVSWMSGHSGPVKAAAIAGNGEVLVTGASGHDDSVKLWRTADRAVIRSWPGYVRGPTISLSPDGMLLATVLHTNDGVFRLITWRTSDGTLVWSTNVSPYGFAAIAFAGGGQHLAAARTEGAVDFWDVTSGQRLWSATNHPAQQYAIASSADGTRLATAQGYGGPYSYDYNHRITVWSAGDGGVVRTLSDTELATPGLAFSPDGGFLAGGSATPAGIGATKVWRVSDGTLVWARGEPGDGGVAFSADGRVLLAAGADVLRFWRASDGKLLHVFDQEAPAVWSLASTSDGSSFLYGRDDATVVVAQWPVMFTRSMALSGGAVALEWGGGQGPYQLQLRTNLTTDTWRNTGFQTFDRIVTNTVSSSPSFLRIVRPLP
jgi:WD40 repeat protein